jgi:PEP-CTERM motif
MTTTFGGYFGVSPTATTPQFPEFKPAIDLSRFGMSRLSRSPTDHRWITHKSPLVHCPRKPINAHSARIRTGLANSVPGGERLGPQNKGDDLGSDRRHNPHDHKEVTMKTQITKQHINVVAVQPETNMKTKSGLSLFTLTLIALALTFGITGSAVPAAAGSLGTSGTLSLPSNCAPANCGTASPGVFPTVVGSPGNFTGTWPSNIASGWQGSFTGNGFYPTKGIGTNTFDFSGLQNGFLPAGSIIYFGDLDDGSGENESFSLTANGGAIGPWLNSPFYVSGTNPSDFVPGSMPEYSWDPSTGTYLFDGNNVQNNPTIGVWLKTTADIYTLSVTSTSDFANFGIAAPVPEPSSLLLLGSGVLGLGGLLRRRLLG